MIYAIISITFAIILLTLIVIYFFKVDNKLVNYKKGFEDTFKEMDSEMDIRIENIRKYIKMVNAVTAYNKEASESLKNLQTSVDSYFSSGTRKIQMINNDNITRNFNILNALLTNNDSDLTKDITLNNLIEEIRTSENKINFSKKNYNVQAKNYNELITKFPSKLIAKMFKYQKQDLFGATYE